MPTVWFIIVSVMIAAYVVLDGFDLGAGTHLSLRGTHDRRTPQGASVDRSCVGRQ